MDCMTDLCWILCCSIVGGIFRSVVKQVILNTRPPGKAPIMDKTISGHFPSQFWNNFELSRFDFARFAGENLVHDLCKHDRLKKMPCMWVSTHSPPGKVMGYEQYNLQKKPDNSSDVKVRFSSVQKLFLRTLNLNLGSVQAIPRTLNLNLRFSSFGFSSGSLLFEPRTEPTNYINIYTVINREAKRSSDPEIFSMMKSVIHPNFFLIQCIY